MRFVDRIDEFHESAIAACSGLTDFGPRDYIEPMRLMLADVDEHCRLSPLGEQIIAGNMVGHLAGRLAAHEGYRRHPSAPEARIERPIFIVGAMRTGTTALQRLLLCNPDHQGLELWLANAPQPRPPRDTWESNPSYTAAAEALDQFYQAAPIRGAHPMQAGVPDECFWVLDHAMWSPPKSMFISAPRYLDWCLRSDASHAYRYYRQALRLIGGDSSRRWVLKSPCHLWGLDALLEVFPDACVVFTHRDIVTAMTSTASVAYAIHHPVEPSLSPQDIGMRCAGYWGRALDKAEEIRRRNNSARFFDVTSNEIEADPLGTVERIYRHFDFPITDTLRDAVNALTRLNPRAGHVARQYRPEDFGFTIEWIDNAIGRYRERLRMLHVGH